MLSNAGHPGMAHSATAKSTCGQGPDAIPDPNFPIIQLPTQFKARKHVGRAHLKQGESIALFDADGPGCIRHITVLYKPFSDDVSIEVYADGATQPQVAMSLNAFLGALLNQDPREGSYRVDGAGIKVLPEAGYNCYLPIPFQTSCKILVKSASPNEVQFYSQADWQQYAPEAQLTPYRLHALHRKETPAQASPGGTFQIADLDGGGFVAGIFKAIRWRDKSDLLYHTGGLVWLIDGETDPHALRGYNEEDDLGFGWGYWPFLSRWSGCAHVVNPGAYATESIAYRFFGPDPIPFRSSLIAYCGSRADDTEAVLYFYKTHEEAAPPVETPQEWQLVGPFHCDTFARFQQPEAPETEATWPESWKNDGRILPTLTLPSRRTWVDMTWAYRGRRPLWNDYAKAYADRTTSILSDKPVAVSAYARTCIVSQARKSVRLRLAFNDWLSLWVNGEKIGTRRHDRGLEIDSFLVTLRKGANIIQLKLSNFDNQEHRLWAFSCAIEDAEQGTQGNAAMRAP